MEFNLPTCKNCGSFVDEEIDKCPFCGADIDKSDFVASDETVSNDKEETKVIPQQQYQDFIQDDESNDAIIIHTPDIDTMDQLEAKPQYIPKSLEITPQRNYLIWFILGIVTVGLFFLIYLFINIEDLEKHSHYPNDSRAERIQVSASQTLMIFFIAICFGFIPVLWWIYHKKYSSLYYHLRDQKKDIAPFKIPHPAYYMVPLILSHLIALIPTIINFATSIDIRNSLPALFWSILGIVFALTIINLTLDFFWQKAFNAHIQQTMVKLNLEKRAGTEEIIDA